MKYIQKIKLHNFKRFKTFTVDFDKDLNILVGDNESGKSSILTAINLVLSGSISRLESIGLESLFNIDIIHEFLQTDKPYDKLPVLFAELYLNEQHDFRLNGKINSDERICDGLRLECTPNDDLSLEIKEILTQKETIFPFEYYTSRFTTFSGEGYTGNRKFIKHILIDNSQISSDYAIREYVKDMYNSHAQPIEKHKHQNEYRKHKEAFKNSVLSTLNSRIENYSFSIRNNSKANLETDLTICEDEISIENKGKGKQCFIKTQFALNKKEEINDIILIEEPENHLSHINMKSLIRNISESTKKQLFIATHNNMISTRLDLRKSILLNSNSEVPVLMKTLSEPTAKFFMKAPDNNILAFILSKKVILVEGDAEYILMESFFKKTTDSNLESSDVHVLSVDGTSFKRYLDLAVFLKIKTVVIRDNDKDYTKNCVDNYSEYLKSDFIKIHSDTNNDRFTFEICIYQDNKKICDDLFSANRKTLTVQEYMINDKANVAFELLDKKSNELNVPKYIAEALLWIKG